MFDKTLMLQNIDEWWSDNGDVTRRLNYDHLTEDSVIMDLGGFNGDWTANMVNKYNCTSHIFEPVEHLIKGIASRFAGDKRVKCYDVAVGNEKKKCKIYHGEDETSLFSLGSEENFDTIKMVEVEDVFNKIGLDFVDVIKLNIEGGEFDLLDAIIAKNIQPKLGNLQIQFHKVADDSIERRESICKELSKTHVRTWNYSWVWENWELK